jgi:hypothetical protein
VLWRIAKQRYLPDRDELRRELEFTLQIAEELSRMELK